MRYNIVCNRKSVEKSAYISTSCVVIEVSLKPFATLLTLRYRSFSNAVARTRS